MENIDPSFQRVSLDIQSLYAQQKEYERESRYMEADMIKKKIKEMKDKEVMMTTFSIKSSQKHEKDSLEKLHLAELQEFQADCKCKIEDFLRDASASEEQMLQRHQTELGNLERELRHTFALRFKESSELLQIRKTQQQHAKMQEYVQAHKLKKLSSQLESQERYRFEQLCSKKLNNHLSHLRHKQQAEHNALKQRVNQWIQENKKVQNDEKRRITQKYLNVKKQLDLHHNNEMFKMNKSGLQQRQKSVLMMSKSNPNLRRC